VGHVRTLTGALGLFLGVGLAVSAAALALFAWISRAVLGAAAREADAAVVEFMRANQAPVWDGLALAGAALGSGVAMWVVLIIGTVLLWRSRHHYSVLLLWVALLGGRVLNHQLKVTFGRERPSPDGWDLELLGNPIAFPTSFSFPSGHATTALVVYGTIAYLVARLEPTRRQRRWTLGGAATLILFIGWSRIYLGVHYLSDVIAGYLSGLAWVTLVAMAIEVIRHFATFRPDVAEEEKDIEKGAEPVREALQQDEP
jgi:undecaprenyl-diphosphatase